jgi:hypothetical protein
MIKLDHPTYELPFRPVSPVVTGAIKKFSEGRRNSIRGAVADARRGDLTSEKISTFRNNTEESDMVAAATILESPGGLRNRSVERLLQQDISMPHSLEVQSANLEAAYACGFLNSWKLETIKAVETISILSSVTDLSIEDSASAILAAAQKWGASNYISRKIAYAKEFFDLDGIGNYTFDSIDRILGHRDNPFLQYSALETIKGRISLFSVARRHTNTLMNFVKGDFRRWHSLNNLVATPFSYEDSAGFLLRSVETSLIDTVASIL